MWCIIRWRLSNVHVHVNQCAVMVLARNQEEGEWV